MGLDMAKIALREASAEDRAAAAAPLSLAHSSPAPSIPGQPNVAPLPTGETAESVRQEIADAQLDAEGFYQREPDEVIKLVSGHCARLSTLRTNVGRYDGHPVWRRIKVELEETLEELRSQFQYHSRIIASRELDWRIETGGRQT